MYSCWKIGACRFLDQKGRDGRCHDLKTPHCRILIPGAGKGRLFLLLSRDLRACKLGVWGSLCAETGVSFWILRSLGDDGATAARHRYCLMTRSQRG